jgi:hypothetical protein
MAHALLVSPLPFCNLFEQTKSKLMKPGLGCFEYDEVMPCQKVKAVKFGVEGFSSAVGMKTEASRALTAFLR